MSAPRTARERVREEMTAEILGVARAHLAREGAAALSVRSVARDLEMAPSALYRYFDGRDALLSALILSAYQSLADEAERAADEAERHGASDAARWRVVPSAVRAWALAHPHEWGLVFGTPVPGYQAPLDTVEHYVRIAAAMVRPVAEAEAAGRLGTARSPRPVSDSLRAAVAPVAQALLPEVAIETVVVIIEAWTTMIGLISLEVFGHWRRTISDPGALFDVALRDLGDTIGLA